MEEDLNRTMRSCGGSIQTTVHDLNDATLAQCALFEERKIDSAKRYLNATGKQIQFREERLPWIEL